MTFSHRVFLLLVPLGVKIKGFHIDSLTEEKQVDEKAVKDMLDLLDKENIFIETLVLNATDQGLNIKIFENPLSDQLYPIIK